MHHTSIFAVKHVASVAVNMISSPAQPAMRSAYGSPRQPAPTRQFAMVIPTCSHAGPSVGGASIGELGGVASDPNVDDLMIMARRDASTIDSDLHEETICTARTTPFRLLCLRAGRSPETNSVLDPELCRELELCERALEIEPVLALRAPILTLWRSRRFSMDSSICTTVTPPVSCEAVRFGSNGSSRRESPTSMMNDGCGAAMKAPRARRFT